VTQFIQTRKSSQSNFRFLEWTKEGMSTPEDGRSGLPKEGRGPDSEGLVAAINRGGGRN
jgi:hypothetical protein